MAAFGEKNAKAKLDAAKVEALRKEAALKVKQAVLAKKYGISQGAVSKIVAKKIWKGQAE